MAPSITRLVLWPVLLEIHCLSAALTAPLCCFSFILIFSSSFFFFFKHLLPLFKVSTRHREEKPRTCRRPNYKSTINFFTGDVPCKYSVPKASLSCSCSSKKNRGKTQRDHFQNYTHTQGCQPSLEYTTQLIFKMVCFCRKLKQRLFLHSGTWRVAEEKVGTGKEKGENRQCRVWGSGDRGKEVYGVLLWSKAVVI